MNTLKVANLLLSVLTKNISFLVKILYFLFSMPIKDCQFWVNILKITSLVKLVMHIDIHWIKI